MNENSCGSLAFLKHFRILTQLLEYCGQPAGFQSPIPEPVRR
ncbi:hypothetical protein [Methanosarcina sp. DH1]|nr:hypothetical protein [Methanosarcina sp. DH1]